MATEVGGLLSALEQFGANYCRNAKSIASGEAIRIIEIYETGLAGALSGITELVNQQYDTLPDEQKKEADRYVQLSGTRSMLEKANQTIIEKQFTEPDALDSGTELFQKIETIIKDISNFAARLLMSVMETRCSYPRLGKFATMGGYPQEATH